MCVGVCEHMPGDTADIRVERGKGEWCLDSVTERERDLILAGSVRVTRRTHAAPRPGVEEQTPGGTAAHQRAFVCHVWLAGGRAGGRRGSAGSESHKQGRFGSALIPRDKPIIRRISQQSRWKHSARVFGFRGSQEKFQT